ncbi:class I glutamine amidotransferase-like protein [Podospora aff. communis PSN243]|jgi:transcriptional regulator GlxA family with amidase domain|uniref:Class I glutamine amidotransferase-like protein n=1 Tax=Podospora aff. communis PSN243 TaxID=3040156 RepID=A0AAV9GPC5_9PEZI|nr:class I glutamine amidotransferase-like protein [Podospora aff. communis PSN243]
MASKTSAVADEPVDVLFALHPKFNLLDFAGPLEVLTTALHDANDKLSKAFEITIAAGEPKVLSEQGVIIGSQVSWKEAHERLSDFDVLVVVGGNVEEIIKQKAEPLDLITAFSEVQKADPARERTLLSICTGSLLLAQQGILAGLSATTHPDFIIKFENLCSQAAVRDLGERTDVVEDTRYVVNNLRFELGDEDENPYIRRKSDAGRRPSNARKGSISLKNANSRRESIARRAAMRLGGLRVITSGGVAAGIDAALYLVGVLVSEESANEVARVMQLEFKKGIVVDGIDV